jgi:hypothetical protein
MKHLVLKIKGTEDAIRELVDDLKDRYDLLAMSRLRKNIREQGYHQFVDVRRRKE